MHTPSTTSRLTRRAVPLLAILATACGNLTKVDAPDVVQPGSVANPTGAQALRIGAISRFYLTVTSLANSTGLVSDELIAGYFNSNEDKRLLSTQPTTLTTLGAAGWIYGSQARLNSLQAVAALRQYAPTPAANIGELFSVVAYTELFFGEDVCSPVPLGSTVAGQFTFGVPIARDDMLRRAAADFDSALALSTDTARFLNLARVGKARALQQLGRHTEAAAAVAAVPTSFVFQAEFTAAVSLQQNTVYSGMFGKSFGVADREGGNGLDFRSANDPRVPTVFVGQGQDPVDIYRFGPYTSLASPITLASGIEARLIEAEALLSTGDAAGAVAKLNALRATSITPALAPLTLQATTTAQVDQLFRERGFWLFATGHRLGDLRRLARQYGRPVESIFPTGIYRQGSPYGPGVTLTPDQSELNNPNFVNTVCDNRIP
jgi:hypothetical protein